MVGRMVGRRGGREEERREDERRRRKERKERKMHIYTVWCGMRKELFCRK